MITLELNNDIHLRMYTTEFLQTGLGVTNFYQEIKATRLQHLELEYINNTVCDELYADDDWDVQDNMMCARNNDPTKQACFGDSGGPLYDNKEQKLVGVTSSGDSDCTTKSVVYARIAAEVSYKKHRAISFFCVD